MNSDLRSRSINAFKWNVISQFLNQFLVIVINILLIRELTPHDYGLYAVPLVVYSFLKMIQDLGFSEVFIKEKEIDFKFYSSIFWLVAFVGLILSVFSYLLSPVIQNWTGFAESKDVNRLMSLALLVGSFYISFDVMFRKLLDFRSSFWIEFISNIVSGVCGLWFVYNDYGVLSLVNKHIIYNFGLSIFSYFFSTIKPVLYFNVKSLLKHYNFALPNITDQILNFFYRNLDTLLIGKYLGSVSLGIYDRAYKFLLLPIQQISSSFSKVMYPTFSNFKEDKERLGENFLRICKLISLVTFPLMFGLFVLSNEFVNVIFGKQWEGMIPLLQLFCLIGAFQSISSLSSYVFFLTDKSWLLLKYSITSKLFIFIMLFIAIFQFREIYYVALSITISSLILTIPLWYLVAKALNLKLIIMIKSILPQMLSALIMMCIVYLIKILLSTNIEDSIQLVCLTLVGILAYWLTIAFTKNEAYMDMKKLLLEVK